MQRARKVPGSPYCGHKENCSRLSPGDGAGGRSRTDDLLITNQLLYQLSYTGLVK